MVGVHSSVRFSSACSSTYSLKERLVVTWFPGATKLFRIFKIRSN